MTEMDARLELAGVSAARLIEEGVPVRRFTVHVYEVADTARPIPGSRDVMVSVVAQGSGEVDALARAAAAPLWQAKYLAEMPPTIATVIIDEGPPRDLNPSRYARQRRRQNRQ
jgi:hypothetical protein